MAVPDAPMKFLDLERIFRMCLLALMCMRLTTLTFDVRQHSWLLYKICCLHAIRIRALHANFVFNFRRSVIRLMRTALFVRI